MAALRDAVAALSPAELREPERVAEVALVTTVPDAAATFPTVRETAIRAELAARGIRPAATAPRARRPGRRTPRGASSRWCSPSSRRP
jgi:hypothetical protein